MVTKPLIRQWLQEKHCTLWLNWDLTQPESLEAAVDYVYDMWHTLNSLASPKLDFAPPIPPAWPNNGPQWWDQPIIYSVNEGGADSRSFDVV